MVSATLVRSGRVQGADTTAKILTAKIQKRPIRENFQQYSSSYVHYMLSGTEVKGQLWQGAH